MSTTGTATKRAPIRKTSKCPKLDDSDENYDVVYNNEDLDDDWGTAVDENRRFR